MQIIPTILEKEYFALEDRLNILKDLTKWVQIDVVDNFFRPGKTFELEMLSKYTYLDRLLIDVHLMVKNPEGWIGKCEFVGAQRIIGHVEAITDRCRFIDTVHAYGAEAALAFDINTPIDIDIPKDTDLIVLLARPAGFGQFPFDDSVFAKIKAIKKLNFPIAIDGGVSVNNLNKLITAGVDIIYSGKNYFSLVNDQKNNQSN
jgi:ribulose-phosphate 3-epimerase